MAALNPEAVIERLAAQIGHLSAEVAMRDVALAQAQARIAELEQSAPSTD
jgi:hypothetical protein